MGFNSGFKGLTKSLQIPTKLYKYAVLWLSEKRVFFWRYNISAFVRTSGHGQRLDINIRFLYQHDFVLQSFTVIQGPYIVNTDGCSSKHDTYSGVV